MKLLSWEIALGLVLAAAVGGGLWYVGRRGGFNPANPGNVVNQVAESWWQGVTGDPTQTIGGSIFDARNPRAGLADNEYSPSPGVIITLPRGAVAPVVPAVPGNPSWIDISPFMHGA